ncbi:MULTISPECIES: FAD-binding oxidoreductase [Cupriavidus]
MPVLLDALRALLGQHHVLTGADAAPYLTDWRKLYRGNALAVVRPGSTEEVAAVVRLCARHGAPVVPQGGNTGQCGGATPDASGRAVVVLLGRLDRVREIDTANDTITVEAGCVLQAVQAAAHAAGRLFPLSLGAEGSCMIGGNLASNAGGTQVLRYGNARELALGLEVVTAEGEIWHGLRGLRKDNAGYDLRDLYIGSEGTLGIITAATLKLFPLPAAQGTALAATDSIAAAVALLARSRARAGAALTGFELMSGDALELVTRVFPRQRLPLPAGAPWYVLLETSDSDDGGDGGEHARGRLERLLGEALEAGEIGDAAIAGSLAQADAFWHLRESITLALAEHGKCVKHDISVPTSRIAGFVEETGTRLRERHPGARCITFGHLGDGNLHYNVIRTAASSDAELLASADGILRLVHDSVRRHAGSISAEQGIGQARVDELVRCKDPLELALMRRVKQALDPLGIMNPGKVFG